MTWGSHHLFFKACILVFQPGFLDYVETSGTRPDWFRNNQDQERNNNRVGAKILNYDPYDRAHLLTIRNVFYLSGRRHTWFRLLKTLK